MNKIGMIWAQSLYGVIGVKNALPWHLPEDLKHFSHFTKGQTVIMGRHTWDSLPQAYKPLPERQNIVLTSEDISIEGVLVVHSIEDALEAVKTEEAWIIGGGQLYASMINKADILEVTYVDTNADGDAYAPAIPNGWDKVKETDWLVSANGLRYRFVTYIKE